MVQMREPLLGTRAEADAHSAGSIDVPAIANQLFDEVARLEAVFTVFDKSSELHEFRRTGSTNNVALQAVQALAESWRGTTANAFHAGLQPLIDLWDAAQESDRLPQPAAIAATVADLQGPAPASVLNLNAIAKGWIAETALTSVLANSEADGAWLSLGGDVVHCGNGAVMVGIEDPHRPYDNVTPLATIELQREALATSGTARRWWTIGDRRFAKVLDPRTGWPVDHIASATVVASSAATADVLATVALVLQPEETLELVSAADAASLIITADGVLTSSSPRFRVA